MKMLGVSHLAKNIRPLRFRAASGAGWRSPGRWFFRRFFLLDEPFTGIDPIAVAEIQKIVRRLIRSGIGILITDHNVRETLGICDRAYIVNEGTILEEGTPPNIAASAKARKFYLGEDFKF
jgi:lipopolysaccharide export system ATP-binding protein